MSDVAALERRVEQLERDNAKHLEALEHAGQKARDMRQELDRAYQTLRELTAGVDK
jgi:nitrate/nitrite-specific signal transduction histidine kinase